MKWTLVGIALFACTVRAQSAAPVAVSKADALATELREVAEAYRVEHGIVGMSIAVIDDGAVIADVALGSRDREAKLAVESATLFRLASVSKPVTATAIMQLVDAKKLALDSDVHGYVRDLEPKLGALTLRRILSHTSGLRHYRIDRVDGGTLHRSTSEALELFVHDELLFEPGTKYSYSTHAFTLAHACVESASGLAFPEYIHARIAKGVAPSLACEVASEREPARSALYTKTAVGVVLRSEPREDLSWKYGGGGLESTAVDLARFCDAVLRAKLVSASARDLMWTPAKLNDGSALDYGLGWRIEEQGNAVRHSGSQQGSSSTMLIVRDAELVIVVLTNTENGDAPGLMPKLRELCSAVR